MKSAVVLACYLSVMILSVVTAPKILASEKDKSAVNIKNTQSDKTYITYIEMPSGLKSNATQQNVLLMPLIKEALNTRMDSKFWRTINRPNDNKFGVIKNNYTGAEYSLLEDSLRENSKCTLTNNDVVVVNNKVYCKAKPKINLRDQSRPIFRHEEKVQLMERDIERVIDSMTVSASSAPQKNKQVSPTTNRQASPITIVQEKSDSGLIVSQRAQQFECKNGDATREIGVEYLRRSEFVCRVKYERDGDISYPWEARFGREFCHSKAQELFQTLKDTGIWECSEV